MNVYKKQVIVNGDYLANGQIIPRSFRLKESPDIYNVDKIIGHVPVQASLAGICGECWTIKVSDVKRNLYRESNNKWYIESVKP